MKTNEQELFIQSVIGSVAHPTVESGMNVSNEGNGFVLPMVGGITYNFNVGDKVFRRKGEHVEPSVSIRNSVRDYNNALNTLACIGNEAVILDGEAKGKKGIVIGKHGGVEHVIIQFDNEIIETMSATENILIKAFGQGLELSDFPEIAIMNIDPKILKRIVINDYQEKIEVLVTKRISGYFMGSGMGCATAYSGDFDLMSSDKQALYEVGLQDLCIGDFVYIEDIDARFGRGYRKGYCTVGIIVHGDSQIAGHGPGVMAILSGEQKVIKPKFDETANFKNIRL